MTDEHIRNRPAGAVSKGAAEQADGTVQPIEENLIHGVVRRNHKAKLQLARQLMEQGLDRKSIERILKISVSELFL